MEDGTMERVFDSEEEYYFLRPKTKTKGSLTLVPQPKVNTKDIIKTKPITKPETKIKDGIYSGIK